MSRVRVSTTLDAQLVLRARQLTQLPDSKLLDRALLALLERLETERELAALERHPYHEDPDLSWEVPASPLPYDGAIPAEVLALAERRRVERDG